MHHSGMISIWYFIGLLLVPYGLLTFGAGVYEYLVPRAETTVLSELHAGIWWGLLILGLGAFWSLRFRPGAGR